MDFNEFHRWVHRELGINLCAYKPEQLNRRINSLMTRVGIKQNFLEILNYIQN